MSSVLIAVTSYSWSEHYQAQIALRQLEDCSVPCECHLCATAYLRLQRIKHENEERELRRPSLDYVQYD